MIYPGRLLVRGTSFTKNAQHLSWPAGRVFCLRIDKKKKPPLSEGLKINFMLMFINLLSGAEGRTRTGTYRVRLILSQVRLPIPPLRQVRLIS